MRQRSAEPTILGWATILGDDQVFIEVTEEGKQAVEEYDKLVSPDEQIGRDYTPGGRHG